MSFDADKLKEANTLDEFVGALSNVDSKAAIATALQKTAPPPALSIIVDHGTLWFRVGKITGKAPAQVTGWGGYYTKLPPDTVVGGSFKMTITASTIEVKLFSEGKLVDTIVGNGSSENINGYYEGTWQ